MKIHRRADRNELCTRFGVITFPDIVFLVALATVIFDREVRRAHKENAIDSHNMVGPCVRVYTPRARYAR